MAKLFLCIFLCLSLPSFFQQETARKVYACICSAGQRVKQTPIVARDYHVFPCVLTQDLSCGPPDNGRQSKSLIQHLNKSRIVTMEKEMKTNINIYTLMRYKMQTKVALILTVIVNLPVISLGTWNPYDLYTNSILNFEQKLVINFWSQKALTFSSDSVSKIW